MRKLPILLFLVISTLLSCSKAPLPNFLFAIADDASYPHMSAYGCEWVSTPGFDRVSTDGILFANAYTPNAKCAPSRACILTGRNSWQLEAAANHWPYFPPKYKTFAEVLNQHGYHVGYTQKGYAPGIALNEDGSRRNLLVKAYNSEKLDPPTTGISKTNYFSNFEKFLAEKSDGKPFFFWYGSVEPHRGYEFKSGSRLSGKNPDLVNSVPGFWPDSDTVRHDILDYAFELEYFDSHLVKMLELLEEIGQLDNTLVLVTADNGMPFPRVKGQAYESSNHLPLAISWPEGIKNPGRRVTDMVSFIDFAPTVLELAEIELEMTEMQAITGQSLTDLFYSKQNNQITEYRDYVLIGKERHDIGRPDDQGYPIRGLVKDGMLYIRNFKTDRWPSGNPETGYLNCDGSPTKSQIINHNRNKTDLYWWKLSFGKRKAEELYDIVLDPDCINNLALHSKYQEIKRALALQMESELKKQKDPRIQGLGEVFDNYPYADKHRQDFYNKYMAGEKLNTGWVNSTDYEQIEN